jgi:hypothetical protein
MPPRTLLLRAFAAGQGQSTTARWAPLLSLAVPCFMPQGRLWVMRGRSREDRTPGPPSAPSAPEDLVLAVLGPLDRPAASARHRGRDHDQDSRDDNADDPPDPVNAARRRNPQRGGQVVADEHAADPQTTVSQSGMLSRSPGAKNLPSRPMMMPAMSTPMMSTGDPLSPVGNGRVRPLPEHSPPGRQLKPTPGSIPWLRVADHGLSTGKGPTSRAGPARLLHARRHLGRWRTAVHSGPPHPQQRRPAQGPAAIIQPQASPSATALNPPESESTWYRGSRWCPWVGKH